MRIRCRVDAVVLVLMACLAATDAFAYWSLDGTKLTPPSPDQRVPVIASDSRGGSFIAFTAGRSAVIQHLTVSGDLAAGWPAAGIAIDAGVPFYLHGNFQAAAVASDGQGGVYLACFEQGPYCGNECGFEPSQLYLHRLGANGLPASGWTTEGLRMDPSFIGAGYSETHRPSLVPDGQGGVLIAWASATFFVPFERILTQSVSAHAKLRWPAGGVELARTAGIVSSPVLMADTHRGAFVFWTQSDAGDVRSFVRGQRVNAAGVLQWSDSATRQASFDRIDSSAPIAVSDGRQGAIVAWSGVRAGRYLVYASDVAASSALRWQREVATFSTVREEAGVAAIATAGGGAIFTWVDHVAVDSTIVMAQRLSRDGRLQWGPGALLCAAGRDRGPAVIAADGQDGAFIAWGDTRSAAELFAIRITRDGSLAQGWTANGDVVAHWDAGLSAAEQGRGSFGPLCVVPTDNGSAVLAWQDTRSYHGNLLDQCYAMALTPSGPASSAGARLRVVCPFTEALASQMPQTTKFMLAPFSPNPGRGGQALRFTLAEDAAASVELVDVAGRRIWSRAVGSMGRGVHDMRLAPDVWIPAGTYFVRLTQGEHVATARVTILR